MKKSAKRSARKVTVSERLAKVRQAPPALAAQTAASQTAALSYNTVVERARLEAIRLVRNEFDVKPDYWNTNEPPEVAHELGFRGEMAAGSFDAEAGRFFGMFVWTVEAKRGGEVKVRIAATYVVVYENLRGQKEEAISTFVKRVGQFASYPYFRTLVSHLSAEGSLNLPILPVLREAPARVGVPAPAVSGTAKPG